MNVKTAARAAALAAVVVTAWLLPPHVTDADASAGVRPTTPAAVSSVPLSDDDPGWDCATMGNHVCGHTLYRAGYMDGHGWTACPDAPGFSCRPATSADVAR